MVVGDQSALLGDWGFFGAAYEAVRGLDKATGTYRLLAGEVRPRLGARAAMLDRRAGSPCSRAPGSSGGRKWIAHRNGQPSCAALTRWL